MDPPAPFANLTADCHPIITKSRRYSQEDLAFINGEVERLLKEGIIEPSQSPWRAQVVVTKDENHKKRLAIDYSQTINRFTLLDAFPLPRINDTINDIAQYRVFSTVDLKSAYHQVSLKDEDRPYTAFEARNGLFQFTRLPFGVTNGVACFQREMMKLVQEEDLKAVFPYLDNITICGKNQEDHDKNLTCFLEAAKQKNITYNDDKSIFSTRRLPILGYVIEEGTICPDPERLRPLRELPVPHDTKALNRCLGLFSYYSRWIPAYSDRIKPITSAKSFPLPQEAVKAFQGIKKIIEEAVVTAIDENTPFEVETDASDVALAATLNQKGRPVAFFSRTLQGSELKHASIEKEAQAIVEALRHWKHFLTGRHFTLTTDQKSVSYMFDQRHKGKIKNDKIMRWRIELSCYSFDIVYRPGKDNIPPDTLSRATCAAATQDSLYKLHQSLCHPGITRLWHFIRAKNLPYSLEEVRQMTNSCPVCCECKPKFHHPEETHLIKATQPFERINIDFKGPLPSTNKNRYFLNIIDEFSRFPFVFPCPDVSTTTVIKCLTTLFSLFGMPAYVHSDRGASFMSHELRAFLTEKGVAMSRTTSYNPAGNGQVEKYNGTIWKAITMSLKSNNLPIEHWQDVLPDVLHSVRSLLCTATNETPHERFLGFSRRSSAGSSVPTWLATPGPIYVKRNVRNSKTDPLVDEAELLQANPHYAHVRYPDASKVKKDDKEEDKQYQYEEDEEDEERFSEEDDEYLYRPMIDLEATTVHTRVEQDKVYQASLVADQAKEEERREVDDEYLYQSIIDLEATRALKVEQDKAYQASLVADQAKEKERRDQLQSNIKEGRKPTLEQQRLEIVQSLEEDGAAKIVNLQRWNIVSELMNLYENDKEIVENIMTFQLEGEMASDLGGVSREVYSSFWKEGCAQFCEGNETIFVPRHSGLSKGEYITLGKIIGHGYVLTGFFPVMLSQSYMQSVLIGEETVSDDFVMTDFINYLSPYEANTLQHILTSPKLEVDDIDFVIELEDRYGMRIPPNPSNIRNIVQQMARSELLEMPMFTMKYLKRGMMSSSYGEQLWKDVSANNLNEVYQAQNPNPSTVLSLLTSEDETTLSAQEVKIYTFLKRYVRNLDQTKCAHFLKYCTGSTTVVVKKISVTFYNTNSTEPLPKAHTCGAVLEMPSKGYATFNLFKIMMDSLLENPMAYVFRFQ
ncbi:hypothetical protein QZH41_006538 [Actinostola sp. cb2023]|nr:hypothetical protein QZH41_006538 [Actinostola sp. cb2023]